MKLSFKKGADHWTASENWPQPFNAEAFGRLTGIPVTVVPQGGHNLGKEYVGPLLDLWLKG